MKEKKLEEKAKFEIEWLNKISYIEGSYSTSRSSDVMKDLCNRIEDLESQLEQRGQYGIDWD
jgi:hypothetical protein